ncbi:STB4 [Candida jiufengensis]|uniref:STB4 n=1 Tax=Candida jiufengensis TaxID=497108 RepID=UPI002224362D|nr:STB4 [Candida jiufengensis]KAI5956246.1 STB4 [Candida jiufengensis]
MSESNGNHELPKINIPDSGGTNPSPSLNLSPYGTVQLPPVYSYRQSQVIQQQQQQQQSQSQRQPELNSSNIAQPLQSQPTQQPSEQIYSNIAQPLQPQLRQQDGKPRLRVKRACSRCQSHKIKCSGTAPCTTCVRQKKECIFTTTTINKNDPKSNNSQSQSSYEQNKRQKLSMIHAEPFGLPTVDKSNSSEYVLHLENRVQYLENILSGSSELFKIPKTEEPESTTMSETLFSSSSKWRFSRRHQNLLIVELCKSMYSNLSEESKKQVTIPRSQYFGWNMSGVNYLTSEDLPLLPTIDIKFDEKYLINYFFKEINPLFAILHETVFKEQYEAYDKLRKEELFKKDHDTKTNQTKLFSAILFLVYVLAIRFSEFQKPKGPNIEMLQLEEKLFKYAYKVISILSFEWESFELIQSWLLISLYLRVAHRQTSCSHALGQAVIMTKSMGLGFSEENPKILVSTGYERLKAKRIFWCVFTFDRVFGLQTGRYSGIRDEDFARGFPSFDFAKETEKDDWLTLPALALIHIARISNFVHTAPTDNPHLLKSQQINTELVKLHEWFNDVGFRNDLLFNKNDDSSISSLVKAQVKLHYYDLVLCIHGKVLFNHIGRKITSNGLKLEMVLDASNGVIEVLDKINKANLIYTPWYSILLLLFNIGVNSICLINGGIYVLQSRDMLKNTIKFFTILRKSPIRNDQNKLIFRERFKMVRECTWALKMANKILTLRLEEDMKALNNIGVDHGSSDVNKQYFSQLGMNYSTTDAKISELEKDKIKTNEFNKVFQKQLYRNEIIQSPSSPKNQIDEQQPPLPQQTQLPQREIVSTTPTSSTSLDQNEQPNPVDSYPSLEIDNLLGNLQWFDQWIDFNYDF